MSRRTTYSDICKMLAALRCYLDGQSVQVIATSAGVSVSTVRRWLRRAGVENFSCARAGA